MRAARRRRPAAGRAPAAGSCRCAVTGARPGRRTTRPGSPPWPAPAPGSRRRARPGTASPRGRRRARAPSARRAPVWREQRHAHGGAAEPLGAAPPGRPPRRRRPRPSAPAPRPPPAARLGAPRVTVAPNVRAPAAMTSAVRPWRREAAGAPRRCRRAPAAGSPGRRRRGDHGRARRVTRQAQVDHVAAGVPGPQRRAAQRARCAGSPARRRARACAAVPPRPDRARSRAAGR